MLPVNAPVPEPSVDVAVPLVSVEVVLDAKPRTVTVEPPSAVTFPFSVALDAVTELAALDVTVGAAGSVQLITIFPSFPIEPLVTELNPPLPPSPTVPE